MASYDGLDASFRQRVMALIAASGGKVFLKSGYRSVEEQQRLWDAALRKYGSEQAARKWVAPPGHSNHNRGFAADLGGDLELAAQLAPQFGLHRPMSWEPWHFEPLDFDAGDPDAYTPAPAGPKQAGPGAETEEILPGSNTSPQAADPMAVLSEMLGIGSDPTFARIAPQPSAATSPIFEPLAGVIDVQPAPKVTTSSDPDALSRFMAATRSKESSGNYQAIGVPTQWGRATGAYQFLDSTWGSYKGFTRAADAPPEIQDERARELMLNYYNKFGNWSDVAAAWFSGPNGNWGSREVRDYVADVMTRMG